MNADRMRDLAEIWGGDLRRWPEDARAAATAFAQAHPAEAERALFAARQLDAALDSVPTPAVSAELRDRVLASAQAAGLRARAIWPDLRRLLWIGGAGWAAAACAGMVFGLTLTGQIETQSQVESIFDQAQVGGLDDEAILG